MLLPRIATAVVLLLMGSLAFTGRSGVETVHGAALVDCEAGLGTSPAPAAAPSIRAAGIDINQLPVALWLQRFQISPDDPLDGCFLGYTLLWVEPPGRVHILVKEGCIDTTPGTDDVVENGTPVPNTPLQCDGADVILDSGGEALLSDARVEIASDSNGASTTIFMAAIESPTLGCGGRPCP